MLSGLAHTPYYQLQSYTHRIARQYTGDLGEVDHVTTDAYVFGVKEHLSKVLKFSEKNRFIIQAALNKQVKLKHPHMLEVYDAYQLPGGRDVTVWLEYPNDGSLFELVIKNTDEFNEGLGRWFFQQVVTGVHYWHGCGHALGNIRLENVLLTRGALLPIVKLWPVVYEPATGTERHRSAEAVLDYEAPELIDKDYPVDLLKCDVWALGVLLYRMLCGVYPFTSSPQSVSTCQIQNYKENTVRFSTGDVYPHHMTKSCRDLIQRCLNLNPSERITISEIFEHDWFKESFPAGAKEMNEELLRNMDANDSQNTQDFMSVALDRRHRRRRDVGDSGLNRFSAREHSLGSQNMTSIGSTSKTYHNFESG